MKYVLYIDICKHRFYGVLKPLKFSPLTLIPYLCYHPSLSHWTATHPHLITLSHTHTKTPYSMRFCIKCKYGIYVCETL